MSGDREVVRVYWDDGDGHMIVNDADAKVIEAAPEMLELLRLLISDDAKCDRDAARALLARIEGE